MSFGDVDVCKVVEESLDNRLRQFVDAVYQRRVVPLVGAGVSAGRIPVAHKLALKLKQRIKKNLPNFCDTFDESVSLARAAEIMMRAHGAAEVCKALHIAAWAKKAPTWAHCYLAMLAADGFIDEIISTNYDGGFENAWSALNVCGKIHVVADATELHQPRSANGVELRLYKINGCAKKLPSKPETILLTDSQLQGYQQSHQRRWVRDLLRTTTRSRTLMLSGFSSDEPQVWHVVRLILEELGALQASGSGSEPEKQDQPEEQEQDQPRPVPRLWMALYKDRIPFHLLMVLADEAKLRNRYPLSKERPHKFDNVFSKRDSRDFGLPCGSDLDAGAFWRRIWLEVLQRTLADPEGAVARAFVHAVTGRAARNHPEEAGWFALWESVVNEAFHEALFQEPEEQQGGSYRPRSPGITWAENRYVPPAAEPDYWMAVMLLSLVRENGDTLVGRMVDREPVPELRRRSLGVGSASRPSVSVAAEPCGEMVVMILQIFFGLLPTLAGELRRNDTTTLDFARSAARECLDTALHHARLNERKTRSQRKHEVEP